MSATVEHSKSAKRRGRKVKPYPPLSPRFWHGMRFRDYLRLMRSNRFAFDLSRSPMALSLFPISMFNSTLAWVQHEVYDRKIEATVIEQPPVFIIGHWRSGTTFLHELLIRDEQFAYPTTYECFAPYHFLVSGAVLPRLLWFLLPPTRPMDEMTAGFDRPQEEEFGLVGMGAPSMYFRMAFPNHPAPYLETLNMEGVSEQDLARLRSSLLYFLKAITLRKQKRLMLKSPPHTGRLTMIAEMFPGARFIHITRNPYEIFSSMKHTWEVLDTAQGFQLPRREEMDVDELILHAFELMYQGFDRQRDQIDPSHLYDVRYEDLVRDPVAEVRGIYEQLGLGDFESMRPALERYVASLEGYQTNPHALQPGIETRIKRRWAGYIARYGYAPR